MLLFVIIAVPLMSADLSFNNFNEFFQNNVTQLTITINQSTSQANLYLNTSGTSFDRQDINIQNEIIGGTTINQISVSFNISKILDAINGEVEIQKDSKIPHFNSLTISDGVSHINGTIDVPPHSILTFSGFSY